MRHIFVADALFRELMNPVPEQTVRIARLRADLDKFTEGQLISVAQHPFRKHGTAYMCRLHPPEEQVWEIRSCDPKPGIRVFGFFCEKDVFVALMHFHRADLGGPEHPAWEQIKQKCRAEWNKLFLTYKPHEGQSHDDYASNVFPV